MTKRKAGYYGRVFARACYAGIVFNSMPVDERELKAWLAGFAVEALKWAKWEQRAKERAK